MVNIGQQYSWRTRPGIARWRAFQAPAWQPLRAYAGWWEFQRDLDAGAAAAAGRYEGTVTRASDGATYLRAIELGTPGGNRQPIRIYGQVSGGLPPTPQWEGDALVLGSVLLLFADTDSVADRRFVSLVFGNFMFSFSQSIYHDNRPEVKCSGVLRKQ